jgi:DNA/RNA-binding domain of Phe-tRNA-synthetase-like protein
MNINYEFIVSEALNHTYPGAKIGILALELSSLIESSSAMDRKTEEVILDLREKYPEPAALKIIKVIQAYTLFYKKFKKTYHLIPQLESVIFKNKTIKMGNPLLQVVFTAELKNMLLTAVHDLDSIQFPVTIGIASGEEKYPLLNGSEALAKNSDMFMTDQSGVISTIIYGPDLRTRVTPQTSNALIVVYAPNGVGEERVERHFEDIVSQMGLISEKPVLMFRKIIPENNPG